MYGTILRTTAFRVEHTLLPQTNITFAADALCFRGPYDYVNSSGSNDPNVARLRLALRNTEPETWSSTCIATWRLRRPGPREDPYLREYMMKHCPSPFGLLSSAAVFGFKSRDQFNHWFYDKEELELLQLNGFFLSEYRKIQTLVGYRQSILFLDASSTIHKRHTLL